MFRFSPQRGLIGTADSFSKMAGGFAFFEILSDADGTPFDYRFIEINRSFEHLTGLRAATLIGRTLRETLPGIDPAWMEGFGKVAGTGEPAVFVSCPAFAGKGFCMPTT